MSEFRGFLGLFTAQPNLRIYFQADVKIYQGIDLTIFYSTATRPATEINIYETGFRDIYFKP